MNTLGYLCQVLEWTFTEHLVYENNFACIKNFQDVKYVTAFPVADGLN